MPDRQGGINIGLASERWLHKQVTRYCIERCQHDLIFDALGGNARHHGFTHRRRDQRATLFRKHLRHQDDRPGLNRQRFGTRRISQTVRGILGRRLRGRHTEGLCPLRLRARRFVDHR